VAPTIIFLGLVCNPMKKYFFVLVLTLGLHVQAQNGSMGASYNALLFGTPDQQKIARSNSSGVNTSAEDCSAYGGFLGMVNSLFCGFDKYLQLTGPGSVTKTFPATFTGGYQVTYRAVMTATATTINAVTYSNQVSMWVCFGSSCASTGNFSRAVYMAYNFNKTTGQNQGYVMASLVSPSNSSMSGTMLVVYDISTLTTNKTISATQFFTDGTNTYKMHAIGSKSPTLFQMNLVDSQTVNSTTTAVRFAFSSLPDFSNSVNMNLYTEISGYSGTGLAALDSLGLATPATGSGVCLNGVQSGSSLSGTQVATSSCAGLPFLAFDYTANSTAPNVTSLTAANIGSWNGMAATPSSL